MADNFLEKHYEDYLIRKEEWAKKSASGKIPFERIKKERQKRQKARIEQLRWEK